MSYLTKINEFLATTRGMDLSQLNLMISERDPDAEAIESPTIAHATLGYLESAVLKGETPSFSEALRRANELKEGQEWLFVDDEAPAKPAAKAAEKKAEPAAPRARKSDLAKAIFAELEDKSKANVIRVFQEKLGTTAAGAQTYYYECGGERAGRRGRHPAGSAVDVVRIPKRETPTKLQLARELFAANPSATRTEIIALFQSNLSMTKSGATTYYYTVSKIADAEKTAVAGATAAPAVAAVTAEEGSGDLAAVVADAVGDVVVGTSAAAAAAAAEDEQLDPVTAAFASAVQAEQVAAEETTAAE